MQPAQMHTTGHDNRNDSSDTELGVSETSSVRSEKKKASSGQSFFTFRHRRKVLKGSVLQSAIVGYQSWIFYLSTFLCPYGIPTSRKAIGGRDKTSQSEKDMTKQELVKYLLDVFFFSGR